MMTKCKKLCKILLLVLAVSFVGVLVCIPLGISGTLKQLDELSSRTVAAEVVTIPAEVTTVVLHSGGAYGEVLIRQSQTGESYLEIYNKDIASRNDVGLSYTEKTTADLFVSERFGDRRFHMADLLEEAAFSIQDYPDAVLYITPDENLLLEEIQGYRATSFRFDGAVRYGNMPVEAEGKELVGDHWGVSTWEEKQQEWEMELENRYQMGLEDGRLEGRDDGYAEGYEAGYADGVASAPVAVEEGDFY